MQMERTPPVSADPTMGIHTIEEEKFSGLSPLDQKVQSFADKLIKSLVPPLFLIKYSATRYIAGAPWAVACKVFSFYFREEIRRLNEELDKCGEQLYLAISSNNMTKEQANRASKLLGEVGKFTVYSFDLRTKHDAVSNVVGHVYDENHSDLNDLATKLPRKNLKEGPGLSTGELKDPGMYSGSSFLKPPNDDPGSQD
jgi:hypothetical protein